jgi:pimeloyl-ACP methyl ester carboxylesterase
MQDLPLLLLHGALGSSAQMQPIAAAMDQRRKTYALNLPGHGNQSGTGPFSMALFTDAVLTFLDEKGVERVDIFGYSMGGYVALDLAVQYPSRVGSILTYGTKLDWTPEIAAGMTRMFDAEKIALKAPALAQQLAEQHGADRWPLLCQETANFLVGLGAGECLTQEKFAQIACPVWIRRGDKDQVVTQVESEQIAQWLPQGKYLSVEGGGHALESVSIHDIVGWLTS